MENPASPAPQRRKLPARYAAVVLPLFLSCIMTCLISGISTLRSVGLAPGVLQLWLGSWGISCFLANSRLPLSRHEMGVKNKPLWRGSQRQS